MRTRNWLPLSWRGHTSLRYPGTPGLRAGRSSCKSLKPDGVVWSALGVRCKLFHEFDKLRRVSITIKMLRNVCSCLLPCKSALRRVRKQ